MENLPRFDGITQQAVKIPKKVDWRNLCLYIGGMYSAREDNVVILSKLYADTTGRQITTVGRLCCGDSRLVKRLKCHGSLSRRVYLRITQWFSNNWPHNLPWPDDIPRPAPYPDSPAGQVAAAESNMSHGLELNAISARNRLTQRKNP